MRKQSPTVRTMEPEDAHPLYLECMSVRMSVLRFAAHLAREGYREKAREVRDAADAFIMVTNTGIPKVR